MFKNQLLSLSIATALTSSALAGTASSGGKGTVIPPNTTTPDSSWLSGSITAGWDTDYVWRGLNLVDDNVLSGQVDLNVSLSSEWSLAARGWYLDEVDSNSNFFSNAGTHDGAYNEMNLYARLDYNAGAFRIGPSFIHRNFPRFDLAEQNEVGLEANTTVAGLDVNLGAFYETQWDTSFFQAGVSYRAELNDTVAVVIGSQISAVGDSDLAFFDSGFHHANVSLSLPVKLTSQFIVAPYVAANFSLGDGAELVNNTTRGEDNFIYGGVRMSVSF